MPNTFKQMEELTSEISGQNGKQMNSPISLTVLAVSLMPTFLYIENRHCGHQFIEVITFAVLWTGLHETGKLLEAHCVTTWTQ